jgi:hypothetical protein
MPSTYPTPGVPSGLISGQNRTLPACQASKLDLDAARSGFFSLFTPWLCGFFLGRELAKPEKVY